MNRWFPHKYADHPRSKSRRLANTKPKDARFRTYTSANICICTRRDPSAENFIPSQFQFYANSRCAADTYDVTYAVENETREDETRRDETTRARAGEASERTSGMRGVTAKNKQAEGNTSGVIGTTDTIFLLQPPVAAYDLYFAHVTRVQSFRSSPAGGSPSRKLRNKTLYSAWTLFPRLSRVLFDRASLRSRSYLW